MLALLTFFSFHAVSQSNPFSYSSHPSHKYSFSSFKSTSIISLCSLLNPYSSAISSVVLCVTVIYKYVFVTVVSVLTAFPFPSSLSVTTVSSLLSVREDMLAFTVTFTDSAAAFAVALAICAAFCVAFVAAFAVCCAALAACCEVFMRSLRSARRF